MKAIKGKWDGFILWLALRGPYVKFLHDYVHGDPEHMWLEHESSYVDVAKKIPKWDKETKEMADKWRKDFDESKEGFIANIEKSKDRDLKWVKWNFVLVVLNAFFASIKVGYGLGWGISMLACGVVFLCLLQRYAETKWLDEYLFLAKLS